MKTFTLKEKDINKKWYIVDAEGVILGRLATNVASVLRGKNRPDFTPYMDCGDNVIVINAGKIAFTGYRLAKKYHHDSGYPGWMKTTDLDKLLVSDPERIITNAVKGMLPKGPLGRKIMRNLRVYRGAEHEHAAQKPQKLEIKA